MDQVGAQRAATVPSRASVVFLGDSLTEGWPAPIWDEAFAPLGALNLGVGWDRTEGLLWRLQRQWGEGDTALRPKAVVLLIGTNNLTAGSRPEAVLAGIRAVISFVEARSPETRILLLHLWPRRGRPELQGRLSALNMLIATCLAGGRVTVADLGPELKDSAGGLSAPLYRDGLHLTQEGYERVARVLRPLVLGLLASP